MLGEATSAPLMVTVLAALWVTLGRCGDAGPRCDNGKLFVERDLCPDAVRCPSALFVWAESTQKFLSIDNVHRPEPAKQICMDYPISYTQTLPSSGAYRPVMAESGEYLYCPPQRWLNNLHHGATVLLYHPCAPLRDRHVLSTLARSCLTDFILTSHPLLSENTPIALVSWGHTLELSTMAAPGVCDWLVTKHSLRKARKGVTPAMKYNLLLTWSAERQQQQEKPTTTKASLRKCCEWTLQNGNLQQSLSREIRAASGETVQNLQKNMKEINPAEENVVVTESNRTRESQNYSSASETPSDSPAGAPDHPQIQSLPLQLKAPANISATTMSPLGFKPSHLDNLVQQTAVEQPGTKGTDLRKSGSSAGTLGGTNNVSQNQTIRPKNEGTDSVKHRSKAFGKHGISKNKIFLKTQSADHKVKKDGMVDVKERELERKKIHRQTDAPRLGSLYKPQTESHSQQNQQTDCDSCRDGEQCECNFVGPSVGMSLQRTPRTDEAVWAAGALGFLLVLLTLSVLHTRLYRHWRTMPSLYWRDPRQDYDSVADVIQRRLRIAKRRRKRCRKQECVLLPSSSSSDENI